MMEAETGVVHLPGRRSEEGHSHQGRDEEGAAQHLRGSVVLPTPRREGICCFSPGSQFLVTVAHGLRRRPAPPLTSGLLALRFLVKSGS